MDGIFHAVDFWGAAEEGSQEGRGCVVVVGVEELEGLVDIGFQASA